MSYQCQVDHVHVSIFSFHHKLYLEKKENDPNYMASFFQSSGVCWRKTLPHTKTLERGK
jgi:hypothetical protein